MLNFVTKRGNNFKHTFFKWNFTEILQTFCQSRKADECCYHLSTRLLFVFSPFKTPLISLEKHHIFNSFQHITSLDSFLHSQTHSSEKILLNLVRVTFKGFNKHQKNKKNRASTCANSWLCYSNGFAHLIAFGHVFQKLSASLKNNQKMESKKYSSVCMCPWASFQISTIE